MPMPGWPICCACWPVLRRSASWCPPGTCTARPRSAVCNNLYSSLRVLCGLRPGPDTLAAWDGMRARFAALTDIFLPGAEGYLLACRLRETLSPTMPDAVDRRGLTNQREALFGHPMTGGGIVGELLEMTDELLYRGQQEDACAALDD